MYKKERQTYLARMYSTRHKLKPIDQLYSTYNIHQCQHVSTVTPTISSRRRSLNQPQQHKSQLSGSRLRSLKATQITHMH